VVFSKLIPEPKLLCIPKQVSKPNPKPKGKKLKFQSITSLNYVLAEINYKSYKDDREIIEKKILIYELLSNNFLNCVLSNIKSVGIS
jgi:hypothetical protein